MGVQQNAKQYKLFQSCLTVHNNVNSCSYVNLLAVKIYQKFSQTSNLREFDVVSRLHPLAYLIYSHQLGAKTLLCPQCQDKIRLIFSQQPKRLKAKKTNCTFSVLSGQPQGYWMAYSLSTKNHLIANQTFKITKNITKSEHEKPQLKPFKLGQE